MFKIFLTRKKLFSRLRKYEGYFDYYRLNCFCKSFRESIKEFLIQLWEKMTRRTEMAPLIHPRWIYTIRPEKYEVCFALWTTFRPPKPYFRQMH